MTLKSNVKDLVELLSPDLNAIVFGKQISDAPALPYATFEIVSKAKLGRSSRKSEDSVISPSTAVTEVVETQRQSNVDITFYTKTESDLLEDIEDGLTVINKEALQLAEEFTDGLETTDALLLMANGKFSVLNYTDFPDVDEFLSDSWERRSIIELQINHVTVVTKEIPFISNQDAGGDASITGNYQNPDGTVL